jgi:hypothetical protein
MTEAGILTCFFPTIELPEMPFRRVDGKGVCGMRCGLRI